jgi:hypothetical protein
MRVGFFYTHREFRDVIFEVVSTNENDQDKIDVEVRWYIKGITKARALPEKYNQKFLFTKDKIAEFVLLESPWLEIV